MEIVKKKLIIGLGVTMLLLAGCSTEDPIFFEGKHMKVENVEEILGDRLEDENGKEYLIKIQEDKEN